MNIRLRSMYDSFPHTFGDKDGTVNFYVDNNVYFLEDKKDEHGIALLVEPRSIIPMTYKWIEEHYDRFRYVFTFDEQMLDSIPNSKLLIYGQITAEFPDAPKTKNVSMICSDKLMCEGHRNRRDVARELKLIPGVDVYGKFDGGNFANDADFLEGYKFHVAMENYYDGYYFTEKVCNCFASRIVPIYLGCPRIAEFFNADGIIIANEPEEIPYIVSEILKYPAKEYNKRKEAIEDNFNRVQKYRSYAKLFLETYGDLLETLV